MKRNRTEAKTDDDELSSSCVGQETRQLARTDLIDTFNQKYRMGKKIGEGSSGYVHECLHLKQQKIYACKSMMFDD